MTAGGRGFMRAGSANFGFSKHHGDPHFRLAAQAEHFFRTYPNTCIFNLRQFAELMAWYGAARSEQLHSPDEPFTALLRALGRVGELQRRGLDLFHFLRRNRNEAAHEGLGDFAVALTELQVARELAAWSVAGFCGIAALAPGLFVPLPPHADPTVELRAEMDRLRVEADANRTAGAAAARRLLDHLDQSVYAKAFQGERVPQDPADELASLLPDRIGVERTATPAKARRGRRRAA
ncbi:MAG: hypothetical protein ACOYLU_13870 [Limisphaerales bacterium]